MNHLQKVGGMAALIEAATYLVGIGMLVVVLIPAGYLNESADSLQKVAFLVENQLLMHLWHLIIYLVNGIFLVVLVQALYERLKVGSPLLAQTAAALGLIWAGLVIASGMLLINDANVVADVYLRDPNQAVTVWLALAAVEDGLGGGIELPGGLWMLLVSWAAWRGGGFPKAMNIFGAVVGSAGILSAVPGLHEVAAVFGLGSILWFLWLGIVMLRSTAHAAGERSKAFLPHHEGAM